VSSHQFSWHVLDESRDELEGCSTGPTLLVLTKQSPHVLEGSLLGLLELGLITTLVLIATASSFLGGIDSKFFTFLFFTVSFLLSGFANDGLSLNFRGL
jgi:hypothetical protein